MILSFTADPPSGALWWPSRNLQRPDERPAAVRSKKQNQTKHESSRKQKEKNGEMRRTEENSCDIRGEGADGK